ncbi:MAG: hypothetical protein VX206_07840 [Pseudomonadota bacterium]|nr:hypothetical protein [Pseudomonadota bacterium]
MNTNSTDAETIANVLDGIGLVKVGEIVVLKCLAASNLLKNLLIFAELVCQQ